MKPLRSAAAMTAVFLPASTAALCGAACDLYSLQWHDEFWGSTLDTCAWNYRTDEKGYGANLPANVRVEKSSVIIDLKKEQVGSYNYTGGGIVSKKGFHYGYFECEAKFNHGSGWHDTFWIMVGNGSTTGAVATHDHSEIDIFERQSSTDTETSFNLNLWYANNSRKESIPSGTVTTTYNFTDWHVIGALWEEQNVLFYIDGKLWLNRSFPPSEWTHDYMNIWFTGLAYDTIPDDTYLPSSISANYIRYYKKDYYLTTGTLCFSITQGSNSCPSNEGYSENGSSWHDSTLEGYTHGLATRYSCSAAGAQASWTMPEVHACGIYDVYAWIIARSDSDPLAKYTIEADGEIASTTTIDQTQGSARWESLAHAISIKDWQTWSVTLTASGKGCARADAVKFVRIG